MPVGRRKLLKKIQTTLCCGTGWKRTCRFSSRSGNTCPLDKAGLMTSFLLLIPECLLHRSFQSERLFLFKLTQIRFAFLIFETTPLIPKQTVSLYRHSQRNYILLSPPFIKMQIISLKWQLPWPPLRRWSAFDNSLRSQCTWPNTQVLFCICSQWLAL